MLCVTLLDAILLGLVEGITEYLPVSSTGHLILAASLLGLSERVDKDSVDAFAIVIQGGAILAVLGLYRDRVAQMMRGVLGRDPAGLRLAINLTIAFVPAALAGFALSDTIKQHLFFPGPVLAALAGGGVAMIAIDRWHRHRFHDTATEGGAHTHIALEALSPARALAIGLLQCVAMWPGTSRSMVTIVGGVLVGMRPRHAAEFSFLLGLPTLGAACMYSAAKNFMDDGPNMLQVFGGPPLAAGMIVAAVSAALAVRWLVAFLTRHGLAVFGWYRLALCVLLGWLILQGHVSIAPDEAAPTLIPER